MAVATVTVTVTVVVVVVVVAMVTMARGAVVVTAVATRQGLTHVRGVVFIDEDHAQVLLRPAGAEAGGGSEEEWRCMGAERCGLGLGERFTFYDQVGWGAPACVCARRPVRAQVFFLLFLDVAYWLGVRVRACARVIGCVLCTRECLGGRLRAAGSRDRHRHPAGCGRRRRHHAEQGHDAARQRTGPGAESGVRGGGEKDREEEENGKAGKGKRGGRGRVHDRVIAPICVCARQGAHCIRGIGRGQRLSVLMMPEVRCAIRGELAAPFAPAAPVRPRARSWWTLRPG